MTIDNSAHLLTLNQTDSAATLVSRALAAFLKKAEEVGVRCDTRDARRLTECMRAAIVAMREPSPGQIEACGRLAAFFADRAPGAGPDEPEDTWRELIDAALRESD